MTSDKPSWLVQEHGRIDFRRRRQGRPLIGQEPVVGLALSGGGIRSATFCLGLLVSMGRAKLIPRIDYLSTVSGGGYIGAFLCSLYAPQAFRGERREQVDAALDEVPDDPFEDKRGEFALNHLRESGRHLMTGAGDAIRLLAIAIRNWLAVHLVIGLTLVTFFLFLKPIKAALLRADWLLKIEARAAEMGVPPVAWPSQWLQGYPVSYWFVATPLWLVAALLLIVAAICGNAHWLTRRRRDIPRARKWRIFSWAAAVGALSAVVGVYLLLWPYALTSGWEGARFTGGLLALLSIGAAIAYLAAHLTDWLKSRWKAVGWAPEIEEDRVRHRLSQWMGKLLALALGAAALAFVDSVAQTIYLRSDELWRRIVEGGIVLGIAIPAIRWAYRTLQRSGAGRVGGLLARFGRLIAFVTAALIAAIVGIFWAVLAHALAWRGGPVGSFEGWLPDAGNPIQDLSIIVLILLAANLLLGYSWSFLNLSTFASFYSGRLRRAYLGASNRARFFGDGSEMPANADHPDDDIGMSEYHSGALDAPLHLINVTINDTTSSSSNLTQRDRRGRPLVISSAGPLHPGRGLGRNCEQLEQGRYEELPLSVWMGISGAAFSTGVGQHGSLGLSLLAGLANLRLGYWWEARTGHNTRFFSGNFVQNMLLRREMLGRFSGSDEKRWYLSDGGHFENTGVYELVRRRAGLIIAADCGADPIYRFEDVTRMMRLIRIDFGARLEFLDERELDDLLGSDTPIRRAFASLGELGIAADRQKKPSRFGPYAAIGRIHYDERFGEPPATMLLIKPRVCGSEMPDLLAYASSRPRFPQETTADQFFSEAQWESYFRLGELIGGHIFAPEAQAGPAAWLPVSLRPAPVSLPDPPRDSDAGDNRPRESDS